MNKKSVAQNYTFLGIMLAAMILGALFGWVWPNAAAVIKPAGTVFINMMFCIVVPLVFASISGAVVGCLGEVGVACSMAAAGLAELLGASPEQVCVAAEIGMEHNLGLTCDPVAGQVQVPCIERNAIASVKAINAARMAMRRTSEPRVSLDKVIETMYETGKDMNAKYRETSRGGLAIKVQCD